MTEQITFQYALKLLNQKEEDLLEQASQVRERKTQLIGALRFLGILDLLDFPKDPEEENEKNPERNQPGVNQPLRTNRIRRAVIQAIPRLLKQNRTPPEWTPSTRELNSKPTRIEFNRKPTSKPTRKPW